MPRLTYGAICAATLMTLTSAALAAPKVVTSIIPVHSLIAGVMQGAGEPELLLRGEASPHSFALRPSQARILENADVIFWINEGMESFLQKPLAALGKKARIVTLSSAVGVKLHKIRKGGTWEVHKHDAGHEGHLDGEHEDGHGKAHAEEKGHGHNDHDDHTKSSGHDDHGHSRLVLDFHLWLDPNNAEAITLKAMSILTELDNKNADLYRANSLAVLRRLEKLDKEIRKNVAPVKNRPFIVFHDAYQYFEKRYGLQGSGSVTINPERTPSAKRISEIRNTLQNLRAACIFAEPQFRPTVIQTIAQGTGAKISTLDPLGAALKPGPDAYFQLLENLTFSLRACLNPPA